MNPGDEMKSPEERVPGAWGRLMVALRKIRPAAWVVFLSASLLGFLLWMPTQMRMMIWNGLVARGLLSGMLLLFISLALSLVWSAGQRLDVWVFLFFNLRGPRPLWLDRAMAGFTQLGSGAAALALGLILFLAGEPLLANELVLGTLTLWIVVELLKALLRRSRPFMKLTQTRIVGGRAAGQSFPSGHTAQAFFIATLMAPYFQASIWLVLLLYLLAVAVGMTRIYVGAHYPRDVLAGAILGSAWGLMAALVDAYVLSRTG